MLSMDKIHMDLPFEKETYEAFLETCGLQYEPCEAHYLFREDGVIVGTASHDKETIKLLAVAPNRREGGALASILSRIKDVMSQKGYYETRIFTKPEYRPLFVSLGYVAFAETEDVVLFLDSTKPFSEFIDRVRSISDAKGAIVMNANPFTRGHRYLIEQALCHVDKLLVFVVEEERSTFSFADRLAMVERGTADLPVYVVPGGPFIISRSTFPTYFLKEDSRIARAYARLDAEIYFSKITPALSLDLRFVGTEPKDAATKLYNDALQEVAEKYNRKLVVIPRKNLQIGETQEVISASTFRKLFENKDERAKEFVPETTWNYLMEKRKP